MIISSNYSVAKQGYEIELFLSNLDVHSQVLKEMILGKLSEQIANHLFEGIKPKLDELFPKQQIISEEPKCEYEWKFTFRYEFAQHCVKCGHNRGPFE